MTDAVFLLLLSLLTLLCLALVWKKQSVAVWLLGFSLLCGLGLLAALGATQVIGFSFIRLLSRLIFLFLPAYFLLASFRLPKPWTRISQALGLALLLIAADAFVIEPRLLSAGFHTIHSPLIKRPLRVVSLADIQTDHITEYERKALAYAKAAQPDLVLFPGDYIQESDQRKRHEESLKFNALLKECGLNPRLGSFAVEGDMESPLWPALFAGTSIRPLTRTQTLDLGDLELSALTLRDSRIGATLPPPKKFRIVVGHSPDFALRPLAAHLLLAGHTHGGQVQIPFFGPLLTLSQVPRAWAAGGMHRLESGAHLIVSRGIGMERGPAPRLRFNCRPEIVIVDLLPGK